MHISKPVALTDVATIFVTVHVRRYWGTICWCVSRSVYGKHAALSKATLPEI